MNVLQPLAPTAVSAPARRKSRFGESFGWRFVLLLIAGLAWIVPALWAPTFRWAMVAWDAVLLLGWLIDRLTMPRPDQIEVTRTWTSVLCISIPSTVHIRVKNHSGRALRVILRDHLPPGLAAQMPTLEMTVPARGETDASYILRPGERGDFQTGSVYLRCSSMSNLAERWAVAELHQHIRVYPNFEHAKGQSLFLARSRQLEMQVRQMRLRGHGSEFESLRDYRESDELRSICWTATARRGKLVAKSYQVERSQAVWAVIDCGRLMRTRTEGYSKLDRAVDAALCLAQLALHSGDRFGLLAYGREINVRILPGRGAAHLRQVIEALAVIREEAPEADHVRAASAMLTLQKQRGLIVWITDMAETAMNPEVVESAGQLLSRHVVAFVAVAQPELRQKVAVLPDSAVEMYEVAAAQELVNRRELLLSRLRQRGALALEAMPGQLSTAVLNQYLHIKERNLV